MINLTNTATDLISLVTTSNADIHVVASWVDDLNPGVVPSTASTDNMTPGRTITNIASAVSGAGTTIVATPASSTVRNVKSIWLRNKHASSSNTLTIQVSVAATLSFMPTFTLLAGESAMINDAGVLFVYDVNGGVKVGTSSPLSLMSGAILNTQFPRGVSTINTAKQSQLTVSTTNYYLTSSGLQVPAAAINGIVVGTYFKWRVQMTKDGAGTGIFQVAIFRGTNGSISDTQDVLQTISTQTAVIDNLEMDVSVYVTTAGASGAYFWSICPLQRAPTATGFGIVTGSAGLFTGTVSSVALNTASLIFGLGVKFTTGTPTFTVPFLHGEAFNLD